MDGGTIPHSLQASLTSLRDSFDAIKAGKKSHPCKLEEISYISKHDIAVQLIAIRGMTDCLVDAVVPDDIM